MSRSHFPLGPPLLGKILKADSFTSTISWIPSRLLLEKLTASDDLTPRTCVQRYWNILDGLGVDAIRATSSTKPDLPRVGSEALTAS